MLHQTLLGSPSGPARALAKLAVWGMAFSSIGAVGAQHEATAMPVTDLQRPVLPWQDYAALWSSPQAATQDDLALWSAAVAALGDNAECAYTRWSAPRPANGPAHPRAYADAAHFSLAADMPRWLPLSVWFDVPVVHDVVSWVAERHDPRATTPWTLASMNDRPPSERQLVSYAEENDASAGAIARAEGIAARENKAPPARFHPVATQSFFARLAPTSRLRRDDDMLLLGAVPDAKSPDPQRRMRLTYAVDAATRTLRFFDQRIEEPFSPHFGLRFLTYHRVGEFEPIAETNAVAMTFQELSFTAKLTLVFAPVHHAVSWYGDFQCPDAPASARALASGTDSAK